MGKKMAGTNEFAFFHCKSICTGGGPESGRENSKNAFRPVPVQTFTFPETHYLPALVLACRGAAPVKTSTMVHETTILTVMFTRRMTLSAENSLINLVRRCLLN